MGSKQAKAPDYRGAAEEQARSSLENTKYQTQANRPNQYTPWGSSEWSQDAQGEWTQNIALDPAAQAALDAQQGMQQGRSELANEQIGRSREALNDPFNWGGMPEMGESVSSEYDPRFADTMYDRQMSLAEPQMADARESMEVQLRNQGLQPGTEAYDRAMNNLNTNQGEQMSRMRQDSLAMGSQEQNNQFNRDLQGSSYQNQLRQQAIAEEAQRRGMSINEMNALISGQQVQNPNMPQFSQATKADTTNYMGAAQNIGQNNQFNAGQNAQAWQTGLNFASSMMPPKSDKRLKTNIRKIGEMPSGVGIYRWDWNEVGKRVAGTFNNVGVMAQELMEKIPEAVSIADDGYYQVDYTKVA